MSDQNIQNQQRKMQLNLASVVGRCTDAVDGLREARLARSPVCEGAWISQGVGEGWRNLAKNLELL